MLIILFWRVLHKCFEPDQKKLRSGPSVGVSGRSSASLPFPISIINVIIIAIGIVIMGLKTIIADEALLVWSSPVRVVCISVIRGRLMLMSASPWCEHTYSHICFATLPFGHTRRPERFDGDNILDYIFRNFDMVTSILRQKRLRNSNFVSRTKEYYCIVLVFFEYILSL